jgi:hypothetical protein
MASPLAPIKTPAGQEELLHRVRRLSQRRRTVLLRWDGRRPSAQVLQLAGQAGVGEAVVDELLAVGLIAQPQAPDAGAMGHADLPLSGFAHDALDHAPLESIPASDVWTPGTDGECMRPAARALSHESDRVIADAVEDGADRPLEEAREVLLRALRNEAPVSGSRLKASRRELEDLLDEVEPCIRKPRKMILSAHTLRHGRHLPTLPLGVASAAKL